MKKILIYEDDFVLKEELSILLRCNGYMTVDNMPCDLVLLDINMPNKNGYEICSEIRKKSEVPIIFLTARSSTEDEILSFGVGADDFIRKPYNSSVLLARIARHLGKSESSTLITVRDLTLDLSAMKASIHDKSIELTRNELKILHCLMKKEVCTRDEIIEELWNNSLYIDDNTLGVNIKRLREKLATVGGEMYITTIRGVGYRL